MQYLYPHSKSPVERQPNTVGEKSGAAPISLRTYQGMEEARYVIYGHLLTALPSQSRLRLEDQLMQLL